MPDVRGFGPSCSVLRRVGELGSETMPEFPIGDAVAAEQVDGTTAAQDYDLTDAGSFAIIGDAIFTDAANVGSGTGNYNTFLALRDQTGGEVPQDDYEIGFNSDDENPLNATNDEIDVQKTQ